MLNLTLRRTTIQDSQCTYNVTLRRVHEISFAVEKQQVLLICVCLCLCARKWVNACVGVSARAWECACERVALPIQHAKRRHIVVSGLSDSTIFRYVFFSIPLLPSPS